MTTTMMMMMMMMSVGDVQFKDEYKRRNAELESDNEQLRLENTQLFSATLNERDSRITELEDSGTELKQQMSSLDGQCRSVHLRQVPSDISYFVIFLLMVNLTVSIDSSMKTVAFVMH